MWDWLNPYMTGRAGMDAQFGAMPYGFAPPQAQDMPYAYDPSQMMPDQSQNMPYAQPDPQPPLPRPRPQPPLPQQPQPQQPQAQSYPGLGQFFARHWQQAMAPPSPQEARRRRMQMQQMGRMGLNMLGPQGGGVNPFMRY